MRPASPETPSWLFVGHRRAQWPRKVNNVEAFETDLAAPFAKARCVPAVVNRWRAADW